LERIGRVFAPKFSTNTDRVDEAFDEVHRRRDELVLPEPRLRDAQADEEDAFKLMSDLIDSYSSTESAEHSVTKDLIWSLQQEASAIEQATRQIDRLRDDIWEPFERCARVLHHFGYLDFQAERVTERGQWLADLRVDRPLLIGEALQRNLFGSLNEIQTAALVAALAADEDRDYGELELDDAIVTVLVQFEEIAFEVSNEEWNHEIAGVEQINFSAAAASALWASGGAWSELVQSTRAEEGDLVRLLSRTGEALLQIAGLRETHAEAADLAARTAEIMLREPVR
jgi:superfamily II RNA helicase